MNQLYMNNTQKDQGRTHKKKSLLLNNNETLSVTGTYYYVITVVLPGQILRCHTITLPKPTLIRPIKSSPNSNSVQLHIKQSIGPEKLFPSKSPTVPLLLTSQQSADFFFFKPHLAEEAKSRRKRFPWLRSGRVGRPVLKKGWNDLVLGSTCGGNVHRHRWQSGEQTACQARGA